MAFISRIFTILSNGINNPEPGLGLAIIMFITFVDISAQPDSTTTKPKIYHGSKGMHIESADGKNVLDIDLRLQLRYSYPFEKDPLTLDDFNSEPQHILQIRRARLKMGGHAFTPKLTYYMEYAFEAPELIDLYATYSFAREFKILAGLYKARYNTEKIISSGKQTMANRSLIDRPFTIDRQTGITLLGNLAGNGVLNFSYWLAVLSGTGTGQFIPDDEHLMYQFRGQWNMFGKEMKFESSDIARSHEWRGYLALGTVTNQSQFTSFSQSGGGQLIGYPDTSAAGQYRINQFLIETAFKKSGFSWQQEWHWKQINDTKNNTTQTAAGYYIQLSTFPVTYIRGFPEKLELAGRYANYIPETTVDGYVLQEFAFCLNWFFKSHRNKLTSEMAYLAIEENDFNQPGWRFRLQWDGSF